MIGSLSWSCFVLYHSVIVSSLQWPGVKVNGAESMPNIELSLAPPTRPWPQVTAAIGNLESSREKLEDVSMSNLQKEFNTAARAARNRIGETIGRMLKQFDDPNLLKNLMVARSGRSKKNATLLRQIPQETLGSGVLSVKVNVLPVSPPDPAMREKIDALEHKRADSEKDMFQSVSGEAKSLLDFVINEFEAQLHSQLNRLGLVRTLSVRGSTSFLEGASHQLPVQANVRIVPNDVAYPTVASMVQDMETRRDTTEHLERQRLLEKELDLLLVCNSAMEDGLKNAVDRMLVQYDRFLKPAS